jgi:hypothetical protein
MHANQETGACFPSYSTLSDDTGMSRASVITYRKLLQDLELLEKLSPRSPGNKYSSNRYKFPTPQVPVPEKFQKYFEKTFVACECKRCIATEEKQNTNASQSNVLARSNTNTIQSNHYTKQVQEVDTNKTKETDVVNETNLTTEQVVVSSQELLLKACNQRIKTALPRLGENDFRLGFEQALAKSNNDTNRALILIANVFLSAREQGKRIGNQLGWWQNAVEHGYKPFKRPCSDVIRACLILEVSSNYLEQAVEKNKKPTPEPREIPNRKDFEV